MAQIDEEHSVDHVEQQPGKILVEAKVYPTDDREFSEYSFDEADLEEGLVQKTVIHDVGMCIPSGCRRNLLRGIKKNEF